MVRGAEARTQVEGPDDRGNQTSIEYLDGEPAVFSTIDEARRVIYQVPKRTIEIAGPPRREPTSDPSDVTAPAGVAVDEARMVATRLLAELEATTGRALALWDGQFGRAGVEDHGDVWTFAWNSVAYLASGDIHDQVLSGPIAVPKDGGEPFLLGTWSPSIEEMLASRRAELSDERRHPVVDPNRRRRRPHPNG